MHYAIYTSVFALLWAGFVANIAGGPVLHGKELREEDVEIGSAWRILRSPARRELGQSAKEMTAGCS